MYRAMSYRKHYLVNADKCVLKNVLSLNGKLFVIVVCFFCFFLRGWYTLGLPHSPV